MVVGHSSSEDGRRAPDSSDVPAAGRHGGDGPAVAAALGLDPSSMLDLSQSLNPFAPDVAALAAGRLASLRHYPDPGLATSALAEAIGVDPGRLLLTNGGSEAISLVANLIGGWVPAEPDFSLYPRGTAGPLWRSDPHSPSGKLADAAALGDVWDESFYPLATGRWTAGRPGIVVGSLTKLFACPGLRLGYVIADDVARFARRQPAWAVGSLALALLPPLLHRTDLEAWRDEIAAVRRALVEMFVDRALEVRVADAPWILVKAPGLRTRLAPQGVLVRDCASFGLPGWHRVAVPDAAGWARLDAAMSHLDDAPPSNLPPLGERTRVRAILFDIGDTLVHAAAPATPVDQLRVTPIGDTLAELARWGASFRLGAVTDTSVMTGADMRRVLAGSGLGDRLEVIVTSVDVGAAKPDPCGLRAAMAALGVAPQETVFVGDADVDEQAAAAAGVAFVSAGRGRSPGGPVEAFLEARGGATS